ncbi:hypothetical protein GW17_00018561 [Ensete ventricosum]|nr:hypothetical protein GW17_00018561 [Ensete ventricosum]
MRGFVGTRGCGSQRCCRCGKSRRCPSEVDSLVTTVTGLYRPCTAPNATNSIYSADIPWNNTRHAARIFLLPAPVGSTSRRSLPRIGCAKMHTPLYPKRSETPPRTPLNLYHLSMISVLASSRDRSLSPMVVHLAIADDTKLMALHGDVPRGMLRSWHHAFTDDVRSVFSPLQGARRFTLSLGAVLDLVAPHQITKGGRFRECLDRHHMHNGNK